MKRRTDEDDAPDRRKAGAIVSLQKAALCVECEHISEADGHRCPRCGSPSLLSLARVLDRPEAIR